MSWTEAATPKDSIAIAGTLLAIVFLASPVRAQDSGPATYYFGQDPARTNVSFSSETEVVTITGNTSSVAGSATIDFDAGTGSCHLVVPAASLSTGYPERDAALLSEEWLEVQEHPDIELVADGKRLEDGRTWQLHGSLYLRGVAKDLSVEVRLLALPDSLVEKWELGPGRWIKVVAEFTIDITDHGIVIPQHAVGAIQKQLRITLDLYGSTEWPHEQGLPGEIYRLGGQPEHVEITATPSHEPSREVVRTGTVEGFIGLDRESGSWGARLRIPVAALETGSAAMDRALRGERALCAERHPYVEFESTRVVQGDAGTWACRGRLTLRGVSRPVSFEVRLVEENGGIRLSARLMLDPTDFGIEVAPSTDATPGDVWVVQVDLTGVPAQ